MRKEKTFLIFFVILLVSLPAVFAAYKYNPLIFNRLDYYEAAGGGVNDTVWDLTGSNYLYNCSGSLCWNESKGNITALEVCKSLNSSWNYTIDTTIGNCSVRGGCDSLVYLDYENIGSINISGYYHGQPLDGGIGSGVIWCDDVDTEGDVNLSINGLNITYPDMIVRLARTDNQVKYCNITSNTITMSENKHLVFYVDSGCSVKNTSFQNYVATDLSPGGLADIFNAYAVNSSIEMFKGVTVKNKEAIKTRKAMFRTAHLSVYSGMNLDFDTVFPELYQYSGEYLYVKTLVDAQAQNSSVDGVHLVSHIDGDWGFVGQTGINLTHCDNTTDLVQCPTNKYRRYLIYIIGKDGTTQLHQLAPLTTSPVYNNLGDCMDIVNNPVSYALPSMHEYLAVPTYIYCGLRDANTWDDGWIDIRGGIVSRGAAPDLGNYLSYDGLTENWNQGDYNLTSTNSWFLGKINWSNIQNKLISGVSHVYLYLSGSTLFFNESKLNSTIRSFNGSWDYTVDTVWGLGDDYLYNCTGSLCLDESKLNSTIDSRDSDTTYSAGSYLYLSGTEFNVNETMLNSTVDARDTDTNTWWGVDLADFVNNSNTLELNWTTINSTIDARDDDTTYSCSDWAGCSDDSLWDADKLDGQDGSYYLDDTTIGNCSVDLSCGALTYDSELSYIGNCSNDLSCNNILYKSEIDTFAELDALITDATLINKTFADNTYLDNTDSQTLSFSGDNISISGGNEINISSIDTDTTIGNCSVAQSCSGILYDGNASDFLSSSVSWGGDLGGTGSSPSVDDDSHSHTKSTITISGENITAGIISDDRLDFTLADAVADGGCTDCITETMVDDDGSGECAGGKVCTGGHDHPADEIIPANMNLNNYNISTVRCIVFDNGGKIGNCG